MLVIIARTKFKTIADRDTMIDALAISTAKTVLEPGTLCYQSTLDPVDSLVVNAVEIYKTEQAMVDHVKSDHMAVLIESIAGVEADIVLKGFEGELTPVDMDALLKRQGLGSRSKLNFAGDV